MVSSSKIESLATRFAPYIDELHDFFRSRDVPFGTLGDLQSFPARLTETSFCEEMVSMTRSILYRECEALPRTELMELIAVAVGGVGIEESSHDLHDSLRQILTFVTEAVRPHRTSIVPGPGDGHMSAKPVRFADGPNRTAHEAPSAPLTGLLSEAGSEPVLAVPPANPGEPEINDRLSRALMDGEAQRSAPEASVFLKPPALSGFHPELPPPVSPSLRTLPTPKPEPVLVAEPLPSATSAELEPATGTASSFRGDEIPHPFAVPSAEATPHSAASADGEASVSPPSTLSAPVVSVRQPFANSAIPVTSSRSRSFGSVLRRAYWIPGVFALILVAVAIWLLQNPVRSGSKTTPVRIPAVAASTLPKPSAYGPAIHRSSGPQPAAPSSGEPAAAAGEGTSLPASDSGLQPSSSRSTGVTATAALMPHSLPRRGLSPLASANLLGGREGVFLASSGMMAAHLISAPAPGYPKLASFTRVEGAVIVQVVVGRDGRVEATRVLDGPHLLRGAAEHAIRRWRYRPYVVDGKTTDVATIVTVNFRLTH